MPCFLSHKEVPECVACDSLEHCACGRHWGWAAPDSRPEDSLMLYIRRYQSPGSHRPPPDIIGSAFSVERPSISEAPESQRVVLNIHVSYYIPSIVVQAACVSVMAPGADSYGVKNNQFPRENGFDVRIGGNTIRNVRTLQCSPQPLQLAQVFFPSLSMMHTAEQYLSSSNWV